MNEAKKRGLRIFKRDSSTLQLEAILGKPVARKILSSWMKRLDKENGAFYRNAKFRNMLMFFAALPVAVQVFHTLTSLRDGHGLSLGAIWLLPVTVLIPVAYMEMERTLTRHFGASNFLRALDTPFWGGEDNTFGLPLVESVLTPRERLVFDVLAADDFKGKLQDMLTLSKGLSELSSRELEVARTLIKDGYEGDPSDLAETSRNLS